MVDSEEVKPTSSNTQDVGKPGAKQKKRRRRRAKRNGSREKAPGQGRRTRSFPAGTFEEALVIAQAIQQFAAGQKVRRLTLFDNLKKAPDSGPSRQLVTNSSKYGLTIGGYQAEHLELTPEGRLATSSDATPADRLKARIKLAIENIPPFKQLYDHFKGNKLPALPVMRDFLLDKGYAKDEVAECVDTFIVNAKFLGLLRTVSGAERILPVEHVLEEMPRSTDITKLTGAPIALTPAAGKPASVDTADWAKVCFYITPIGEPESEQRKHSDLFLSSIIERAVEVFGLRVIRADQIGKPGMISRQVIEHVVKSRLVIADLSFHNPNVFYELSLRHACRLPTVQVIRSSDNIPFDLDQFRTVKIDTASIYTLVPQLETYKSEIASQVRRALEDPDVDNPLTVFYPGLRVTFPNGQQ
ncbi:MAG: hypothetical protein LAN70_08020 [Acidobacteriia bacterium]|nr:hypothetical protein [Terriglobia bacterium]